MYALQNKTGLPISTYFSGIKLRWIIENVEEVKESLEKGNCMFGTFDTFLIYKLTKKHLTDVTNASRTLLMNINTLKWDEDLLKLNFLLQKGKFDLIFFFRHLKIPKEINLPDIKSSSTLFGYCQLNNIWNNIPITGVAG
jgi:glycerol kinase